MFQNLKLFAKDGFPQTSILSLREINIVCGKNNSGKSTLLSIINDAKLRATGKQLTEMEKTQFSTGFSQNPTQQAKTPEEVKRQVKSQSNLLQARFKELIDAVSGDKIWYADEQEVFADQVEEQRKRDSVLQHYSIDREAIPKIFKQMFQLPIETIYVEAKRMIESIKEIKSTEKLLPNGQGVLNYLFHVKNQIIDKEKQQTFQQIGDAFTEISDGYKFDIHMNSATENEIVLMFADKSNVWRQAKVCGLGLQDLLIILVFIFHPKYSVILIEEPENHLHPDMQRKLLGLLRNTQKQYFLSTHSNVFLNSPLVNKVLLTKYVKNAIKVDDITSRAIALHDLGYSVADNLVADLIILVEGPTDIVVLEEMLIQMDIYGKYNIKFWPLGGDNMEYVDLAVVTQGYNVMALIDRDDKSENTKRIREGFLKKCTELGIFCHKTTRYAIENYFSIEALNLVVNNLISHGNLPIHKDLIKTQMSSADGLVPPDEKLEDQLKSLPTPLKKASQIKTHNRLIARSMSLIDIEKTDLYEFLKKVENRLKATVLDS